MKGPAFICVISILVSLPVTIKINPNETPACSQLICQLLYPPIYPARRFTCQRKKCDKSVEVIRERPLLANLWVGGHFEWQAIAMLFAIVCSLLWMSVMQGNTQITFKSYNKVLRSYHVKKMSIDRKQRMIQSQQFTEL